MERREKEKKVKRKWSTILFFFSSWLPFFLLYFVVLDAIILEKQFFSIELHVTIIDSISCEPT